MPSFLEKVRERPPERRLVKVIGYDPDLRIGGYASLEAEIGGTAAKVIGALLHIADYQVLPGIGTQRVNAIARIRLPPLGIMTSEAYAIVEGQRIYADPDATRPEIVAKANDLIQVAQVAGAVLGQLLLGRISTIIVEPQHWKGQRKKGADHKETARKLGDVKILLTDQAGSPISAVMGRDLDALPKKWEHAMDALGMALYGLDLLSTNRWPT